MERKHDTLSADTSNFPTIKSWPAETVKTKPTSALKPFAHNPKIHPENQIQQIAASIEEWGWTIPILIDEKNNVVAGHGRLEAAKLLKIDSVPCMVAKGWSDEQKKAYVIADNKIAEKSGWDDDLLKDLLNDIEGFNIELTGIGELELDSIFLERQTGDTDQLVEWEGMPEFISENPCYRKIVVNFDNQQAVENFFSAINQECTDKTKSIWYPQKERRDLESYRFADDNE